MFIEDEKIYTPTHPRIDGALKTAAIDLDDTLAVSIPNWISFVNATFPEWYKVYSGAQKALYFTNLQQMKKSVPYYFYRILKENYRNSDVKQNLPPTEGAESFLFELKELGYKIIIMTGRKEASLKLTVEWLNKNNLYYDELVLDKNKHVKILQRYPNLSFMVEDNRTVANLVASWNYRVYLLDNKYNQGNLHQKVVRIYNKERSFFMQILDLLQLGE